MIAEYVKTMKVLHNKAPESSIEELFETVEKDLKCKVPFFFTKLLTSAKRLAKSER